MDRRLAEAARLGFTEALVPVGCGTVPKGLKAIESATIGDALRTMLTIAKRPYDKVVTQLRRDGSSNDLDDVDNKWL